ASEENIRELFTKAYRTAPSIVFIDEIDVIASKRENLQREMERHIVTQLMTCMDESHRVGKNDDPKNIDSTDAKPGYVLVIGATNRLDVVDQALRRTWRFDNEIALGVPNENARIKILTVLTRNLKLEGAFDLTLKKTKTGERSWHGVLKIWKNSASQCQTLRWQPNWFNPYSKRKGFSSIPDVKWEDVGGLDSLRREFVLDYKHV
nr:hypothetical protein [Tanacetum cinerariifolium]